MGGNCEEQYAGLGKVVYAVRPSALGNAPKYINEIGKARFAAWAFDKANFNAGLKAFAINVKKTTSQNQGTGIEGPKGFGQSLTFVVQKDIENCAAALRVMKNEGDWYFLVPFGNEGAYQVIGDPVYGSTINGNFDSGTTADSDSGITFTVACPSSPYPVVLWYPEVGADVPHTDSKTTGLIATSQNGSGTFVSDEYLKAFHAIGVYVSGTASSHIDMGPDKATVIVEWNKNPYTDVVDYSVVKPASTIWIGDTEDEPDDWETFTDRECTQPATAREDGTFIVRRGQPLYTKYVVYFTESYIGKNISFQARCDFSGYSPDKIATRTPLLAFADTEMIDASIKRFTLYNTGTGTFSINGSKFGSDYKYAIEVSSPGVTTSGGAISNQPVTSGAMIINVNVKEYIAGDKLTVRHSNYVFDIPLSLD